MQQQDLPDLRAAQRRFALTFAPLFLLSLGAHVLGGGPMPALVGVVAGLLGAALVAAILARMSLTVTRVSFGAVVAQIVVHGSFQYLDVGLSQFFGATAGRTGSVHAHHAGAFAASPAVASHAVHSMVSVPMVLAHAMSALCLAIVLVRLDAFIKYAQAVVRPLLRIMRPAVLIVARARYAPGRDLRPAGTPAFLRVRTPRGPPLAFGI